MATGSSVIRTGPSTDHVGSVSTASIDRHSKDSWLNFQTERDAVTKVGQPGREKRVVNRDLPEAFWQTTDHITDIVDHQILSNDNWYTGVILPIKRAKAMDIAWNIWEFDQFLPDVMPHESVARLVESNRQSRQESIIRKGLGFKLEHQFMETPEGRMTYKNNLAQIANAVAESLKFDVLLALVTADNWDKRWKEENGYFNSHSVRDRIRSEHRQWSMLQKDKNSFAKLDTLATQTMDRWRSEADSYILTSDAGAFLNIVPREKTDYFYAGKTGPERVENYDASNPFKMFGRNKIYLARTFAIEKFENVELLVREREIGEFNMMYNAEKDSYNARFDSKVQNVRIFSEDRDDFVEISQLDAIDHSYLWDDEGNLRALPVNDTVPHFKHDIRHHFLYRPTDSGVKGEYEAIELFGEISENNMSKKSVRHLGHTLYQRLANLYTGGEAEVNSILYDGLEVLNEINNADIVDRAEIEVPNGDNIPAGTVLNQSLQAVGVSSRLEDDRYLRGDEMLEFNVPSLPLAGDDGIQALVGRANWPGMLQMATEAGTGGDILTASGYDKSKLKKIAQLVGLIKRIVATYRHILKGTVFMDERYTPAQYREMSAEAVLVDNIFGMYHEAVWGTMGQDAPDTDNVARIIAQLAGADADASTAINNALNAATTSAQLRNVTAYFISKLKVSQVPTPNELAGVARFTAALVAASGNKWTLKSLATHVTANGNDFTFPNPRALNSALKQAKKDAAAPAIAASAGYREALRESPSRYYRSQLTLSASQILQLNSNTLTVSRPGSNNGAPATTAERDALKARINEAKKGTLGSKDMLNAMFMRNDIGNLMGMHLVAMSKRSRTTVQATRTVTGPSHSAKRRRVMGAGGGDASMAGGDATYHHHHHAHSDGSNYTGKRHQFGGTFAANFRAISDDGPMDIIQLLGKLYMGTPITKQTLHAMYNNNVIVPFNWLIIRMHMRYRMKMAIKLLAGERTGNTYVGFTNFEMGDDPKVGMREGVYTFYSKSIVKIPKHVFVMYDVFAAGRLKNEHRSNGAGVKPIDKDEYNPSHGHYGGDLMFFVLPYEETELADDTIDASGRFLHFASVGYTGHDNVEKPHFSTAAAYNAFWRIHPNSHTGTQTVEQFSHPERLAAVGGEVPSNSVCSQGEELHYNSTLGTWSRVVSGKGHWGGYTKPGCVAGREGEYVQWDRNNTQLVASY